MFMHCWSLVMEIVVVKNVLKLTTNVTVAKLFVPAYLITSFWFLQGHESHHKSDFKGCFYFESSLNFLIAADNKLWWSSLAIISPGESIFSWFLLQFPLRLVNGFIEPAHKKTRRSISELAEAVGIPRMLVDIRHGKITPFFFIFFVLLCSWIFSTIFALFLWKFWYSAYFSHAESSHRNLPSIRLVRLASIKVYLVLITHGLYKTHKSNKNSPQPVVCL